MNRLKFALIALLCACVGGSYLLYKENVRLSEELDTKSQTIHGLLVENNSYISQLGRSTQESKVLRLEISDLESELDSVTSESSINKKALIQLKKTLEDIKVKEKCVNSASITASETETTINTSVITADTVSYFNWNDPWVSLVGKIKDQEVTCKVRSNDTLIQVIHRVPKRFLFFKFGTKEIRQTIQSTNPHTSLKYSTVLQFK